MGRSLEIKITNSLAILKFQSQQIVSFFYMFGRMLQYRIIF